MTTPAQVQYFKLAALKAACELLGIAPRTPHAYVIKRLKEEMNKILEEHGCVLEQS